MIRCVVDERGNILTAGICVLDSIRMEVDSYTDHAKPCRLRFYLADVKRQRHKFMLHYHMNWKSLGAHYFLCI